ncbi:MAG: PRD domain-containing protein [Gemella sp.]|nr:PRD domain-containing protein [Gemella sp.]
MFKLNDRELNLIKILSDKKDYLPVKTIADELNVSTKTVFRDIEKISNERTDLIFEKRKGKGIKLTTTSHFEEMSKNNALSKNSIEERRIKMLYRMLIHSNEYTSLENLSYKYYVGISSIVNDLKYLEQKLLGDNLILERSRNGTKIIGSEKDIRRKIAELVDKYYFISDDIESSEYYSERIDSKTIAELGDKFGIANLEKVEHIITKYEKRLPYTIGDLYYTNFVIHILISIERVRAGNYVSYFEHITPSDKQYYVEAQNIANELEEELNIELPDNEIYYIYQYLVSTGVGTINQNNSISVEKNIEKLAEELFNRISASTIFEFKNNEHIYYTFKLHLRALIKRLKYGISINNPLTEKIKQEFKEIFTDVKNISMETLHNDISDDEVAYLTLYIQSILDGETSNKNVVLVCHSGFGTSQFLKKRMETRFNRLNIIDILSSRELNEYDLTKIDYIVSTVNLDKDYEGKVINVNVLLLEEDIKQINNVIFGENL